MDLTCDENYAQVCEPFKSALMLLFTSLVPVWVAMINITYSYKPQKRVAQREQLAVMTEDI